MKQYIAVVILGVSLWACKMGDSKPAGGISPEEGRKALKDSGNYTSITWLDSTYQDLGKVKEGQQVEVAFHFRNSGTKNLVITDVSASCGCTIPEKPGKPYSPGENGVIKARFNSSGRAVGEAQKLIYVTANTKPANLHTLTFRVEITE